jgi:hypothetical protein
VKTSPRMAHSSPLEEKKLGFPFSDNGPSAIQGEGATSPFSDLGEWEERGVTTPIVRVFENLPPPPHIIVTFSYNCNLFPSPSLCKHDNYTGNHLYGH